MRRDAFFYAQTGELGPKGSTVSALNFQLEPFGGEKYYDFFYSALGPTKASPWSCSCVQSLAEIGHSTDVIKFVCEILE